MDGGKRGALHWVLAAFNATTDMVARLTFPDRRYEVRHTIAGALIGTPGFLLGGVGIATHGDAIGASIGLICMVFFAMVGNRWGVERDLMALKRQRKGEP